VGLDWHVGTHRGGAGALHALDPGPDPTRQVWVMELTRPALVLGSAQPTGVVDAEVARAGGIEIVRRRSGGGAVLLEPDGAVWIDVVVPRGDPRWCDDVVASMRMVGRAWAEALRDLGVAGVAVHAGRWAPDELGRLVCFAASGPGEVHARGRKVVGLAQRRTRSWARVQGVLLAAGGTAALQEVLAPGLRAAGVDDARRWPPMGLPRPLPPATELVGRLLEHLP